MVPSGRSLGIVARVVAVSGGLYVKIVVPVEKVSDVETCTRYFTAPGTADHVKTGLAFTVSPGSGAWMTGASVGTAAAAGVTLSAGNVDSARATTTAGAQRRRLRRGLSAER